MCTLILLGLGSSLKFSQFISFPPPFKPAFYLISWHLLTEELAFSDNPFSNVNRMKLKISSMWKVSFWVKENTCTYADFIILNFASV